MMANPISKNTFCDEMKKPSGPHVTYGQNPVTETELKRRKKVAELLESLGISVSQFDAEDEHEDQDVLQAIILATKGEEIPEDLRQRLLDKKEQGERDKDRTYV